MRGNTGLLELSLLFHLPRRRFPAFRFRLPRRHFQAFLLQALRFRLARRHFQAFLFQALRFRLARRHFQAFLFQAFRFRLACRHFQTFLFCLARCFCQAFLFLRPRPGLFFQAFLFVRPRPGRFTLPEFFLLRGACRKHLALSQGACLLRLARFGEFAGFLLCDPACFGFLDCRQFPGFIPCQTRFLDRLPPGLEPGLGLQLLLGDGYRLDRLRRSRSAGGISGLTSPLGFFPLSLPEDLQVAIVFLGGHGTEFREKDGPAGLRIGGAGRRRDRRQTLLFENSKKSSSRLGCLRRLTGDIVGCGGAGHR